MELQFPELLILAAPISEYSKVLYHPHDIMFVMTSVNRSKRGEYFGGFCYRVMTIVI